MEPPAPASALPRAIGPVSPDAILMPEAPAPEGDEATGEAVA